MNQFVEVIAEWYSGIERSVPTRNNVHKCDVKNPSRLGYLTRDNIVDIN